jgi:hypothetical protein
MRRDFANFGWMRSRRQKKIAAMSIALSVG